MGLPPARANNSITIAPPPGRTPAFCRPFHFFCGKMAVRRAMKCLGMGVGWEE